VVLVHRKRLLGMIGLQQIMSISWDSPKLQIETYILPLKHTEILIISEWEIDQFGLNLS
jgi:hypothetical protein